MTHRFAYTRKFTNLVAAALLLLAMASPALLTNTKVYGAQITDRSIDIQSSLVSETDNVYTVTFSPATTGNIRAVVIDFCTTPLVGTVCTAPAGLETNEANSLAVYNEAGAGFGTSFTVDQTESTSNKVVIKDAAGTSVTAGTSVSFDLGDGSADNGIDNPSAVGTFYARIITFAVETDADAYDSSSTGANNPPSSAVDSGGVAMSTVDQLTVTARVQEQLEFCVAALTATDITTVTTGAATEGTCSGAAWVAAGTEVDLGVIDSVTPVAGINGASPVPAANGGNDTTGAMIIRTNAVNGVDISYFAERTTDAAVDDTTNFHQLGALRVAGATVDCNAVATTETDQCFESSTAGIDLSAAGEGFGAQVGTIQDTTDASVDTSASLTAQGNYATGGSTFVWNSSGGAGATELIAQSASVLDYTLMEFDFGARSSATTPTGAYTVTSTYIATATF